MPYSLIRNCADQINVRPYHPQPSRIQQLNRYSKIDPLPWRKVVSSRYRTLRDFVAERDADVIRIIPGINAI